METALNKSNNIEGQYLKKYRVFQKFKQEDIYYEVINYDMFIYYDCSIVQLIIVDIILFKYLTFLDSEPYNQVLVMQNLEILNIQLQQVQFPEEQPQLVINQIPIVNNNKNQQRLKPISNLNLKEKADFIICREQLIAYSDKTPMIQLNVISNIFFIRQVSQNG
ncbi:unnamed protein product [Paramecium sonneborni]|uniref:Uncharacterized protein n=1 Tax=Paramecium sonneborni TaxID=65129 RepID=A0A8S1RSH6_9CILI|nr:unnamed protein product [Paramecium sonneborni]